jgi:predicted permease
MAWKRRSHDDFTSEIQSHLDLETQRLIDEGLSPGQARLAARKAFGSVAAARERFYESGRWLWWDRLRQDVRGAARSLVRHPLSALVAILSLGAGIGATTITLVVRDVVFHKPPPAYGRPQQLSRVQVGRPDRPIVPIGNYVPGGLFAIWSNTLGPAIAAAAPPNGSKDIRTGDRTDTVPIRAVTPAFFSVLEVRPALGSTLTSSASASQAPAAILSYRLWQRLFDGRADVVGREFWIENRPYAVAGVLPERFWFSEMNAPIWIAIEPHALAAAERLEVVARRPAGITHDALAAQLQRGLAAYASTRPAGEREMRLKVSSVEGTPMGGAMSLLLPYVLGASVLLTLVIACANVAILMIAQWTSREHEIAIRASLGASRGRIVLALLTESTALAACGGVLGILATFALRGVLIHRTHGDAGFFDLSIDPLLLLQSALVTFASGIVVGLAPALYETRRLHANPLTTLASSDRVRQRWRHALVILEITVTIALLVETGGMIGGYQRTVAGEMGFDRRPLMSARVENPGGLAPARLLDAVARIPGVASAAASTDVPFTQYAREQRVAADGAGTNAVIARSAAISPAFFSVLDVPLRAGRGFTRQDSPTGRTAIVNEALAGQLFPGHSAVGERAWLAQAGYDIVGVVADYSDYWLEVGHAAPKLFLPLAADSTALKRLPIVVRAVRDPASLKQALRRELRDAAAGNVVTGMFTFDEITEVAGQEMLVGTAPLVPLIAIGMMLTMAGVYGVLAFAITRRSRELAVRVAIGATAGDLVRLVTAHSARLLAMGTVAGIGLTFALSRIVRANGGAGSIYDPPWPAFVVPILIVAMIGALATWIPSRRALKINPSALLRAT